MISLNKEKDTLRSLIQQNRELDNYTKAIVKTLSRLEIKTPTLKEIKTKPSISDNDTVSILHLMGSQSNPQLLFLLKDLAKRD